MKELNALIHNGKRSVQKLWNLPNPMSSQTTLWEVVKEFPNASLYWKGPSPDKSIPMNSSWKSEFWPFSNDLPDWVYNTS